MYLRSRSPLTTLTSKSELPFWEVALPIQFLRLVKRPLIRCVCEWFLESIIVRAFCVIHCKLTWLVIISDYEKGSWEASTRKGGTWEGTKRRWDAIESFLTDNSCVTELLLQRELGCKPRLKLQRMFARGLKQQLLLRLLQKLNDKENLREKQLAKLCKR